MDLKQKYTEVDTYEIDDWFFAQLQNFEFSFAVVVIGQIVDVIDKLPKLNGWTQRIYGVIESEKPFFFGIEYLNQPNEIPILVDIEEVSSDDYLDGILDNKTINQIKNEKATDNTTQDEDT
jgi:hypothetical protein